MCFKRNVGFRSPFLSTGVPASRHFICTGKLQAFGQEHPHPRRSFNYGMARQHSSTGRGKNKRASITDKSWPDPQRPFPSVPPMVEVKTAKRETEQKKKRPFKIKKSYTRKSKTESKRNSEPFHRRFRTESGGGPRHTPATSSRAFPGWDRKPRRRGCGRYRVFQGESRVVGSERGWTKPTPTKPWSWVALAICPRQNLGEKKACSQGTKKKAGSGPRLAVMSSCWRLREEEPPVRSGASRPGRRRVNPLG